MKNPFAFKYARPIPEAPNEDEEEEQEEQIIPKPKTEKKQLKKEQEKEYPCPVINCSSQKTFLPSSIPRHIKNCHSEVSGMMGLMGKYLKD